jgi:hypothetical protein
VAGWYLLIPPRVKSTNQIAENAPLSEWDQAVAFDSAKDCTDYRTGAAHHFVNGKSKDEKDLGERLLDSRCIASDDPRLGEK